jgi:peptide deformylase
MKIPKIITAKNKLTTPTKPATLEDLERLKDIMIETTRAHDGIGLSAIQIGENISLSYVNVKEPIFLVNPVVTKWSDQGIDFREGCLSLPNERVTTVRALNVTVKADNLANEITFGPEIKEGKTIDEYRNDINTLEAVCVQHEIDHNHGVLILHRKFLVPPVRRAAKIKRNDKVMIRSKTGETQYIKFKKAETLINNGEWQLI